jgi:hypothetical protein
VLATKGGRVLRIEVVVHNVKDLRGGSVLDKLPGSLKRMRVMLIKFLGTVRAAHLAFLDEGAFERWSKPTERGTRRLAGIDLNKACNRHVMDAVVALSTRPSGFTLAQVAEAVPHATPPMSKTLRQEAGPPRQGITPLKSRSFRRPGYVHLPHPPRQGHLTVACWCRASLCTIAQSPIPGRSALRQAPRGAEPNL